jgi:hypothetical protein
MVCGVPTSLSFPPSPGKLKILTLSTPKKTQGVLLWLLILTWEMDWATLVGVQVLVAGMGIVHVCPVASMSVIVIGAVSRGVKVSDDEVVSGRARAVEDRRVRRVMVRGFGNCIFGC